MGKLHELLSVEPDVVGTAKAIVDEGISTLGKKGERFTGLRKTYQPLDEEGTSYPPEITQVQETVSGKLDYVAGTLAKAINIVLSKEVTNTLTSAKLLIGKEDFGEFPATVYLALEKQVKEFRRVLQAVPTLDPAYTWKADPGRAHTMVTDTVETQRTEKQHQPVVMYEATKEHPAQVEMISRDVVVGNWNTIKESGMISVRAKSEMLARCDQVIRAIKTARQRANDIEASKVTVGMAILKFITEERK
ncbi:MAG: hypothetical protein KOO63_05350 [Bacteroidales bacterium]|nr:hypothetical protein [Candidatus Latescibacterota bacterium]